MIDIYHTYVLKITLKKLVDNRIYDIAYYTPADGAWKEKIVDNDRYTALQKRENFDSKVKKYSNIPEIVLFNEIKDFFRMFQTEETEVRLDKMELVARMLEDKLKIDIAMDVVGSVNVGMSQPSSDIDFVLYLRCGEQTDDDPADCPIRKTIEEHLRKMLGNDFHFEIIDCINLDLLEKSIRERNYECETTQRFVAYLSICRPINYRVIAPIEDMLNKDMAFRKELEGSIRSYFKIFANTSQHVRSFDKYEHRLRAIGIRLPESIRGKIKRYLQTNEDDNTGS